MGSLRVGMPTEASDPVVEIVDRDEEHVLSGRSRAVLFDLYSGDQLPSGKKSLAFRLELQSSESTLSTEQVNDAVAAVVKELERETGATLRT